MVLTAGVSGFRGRLLCFFLPSWGLNGLSCNENAAFVLRMFHDAAGVPQVKSGQFPTDPIVGVPILGV